MRWRQRCSRTDETKGLAVTAIFLFSVVALLTFAPLGAALDLNTESAGSGRDWR